MLDRHCSLLCFDVVESVKLSGDVWTYSEVVMFCLLNMTKSRSQVNFSFYIQVKVFPISKVNFI
jgi:hypothetical protein